MANLELPYKCTEIIPLAIATYRNGKLNALLQIYTEIILLTVVHAAMANRELLYKCIPK